LSFPALHILMMHPLLLLGNALGAFRALHGRFPLN
jgi:hypothetical protein